MPHRRSNPERHDSNEPQEPPQDLAAPLDPLPPGFANQMANLLTIVDRLRAPLVTDTPLIPHSARTAAQIERARAEQREWAAQHSEALEQVRTESGAAARRYFWLGVTATVLVGIVLTLVGWLLSALNAAQFLSHLLHL
jgi:hypothetical protein